MSKAWVVRKNNYLEASVENEVSWIQVARQAEDADLYFTKYRHSQQKEIDEERDEAKAATLRTELEEVTETHRRVRAKGLQYIEERKHLEQLPPPETRDTQSSVDLTQYLTTSLQILQESRLPTLELEKFSGDPLHYFKFIKRFEAVIETHTDSPSLRLSRLIQYCEGEAKRIIDRCIYIPDPAEAYRRARELLKERFGGDTVITNAWRRKLYSFGQLTDSKKIRDFSDVLNGCVETLRSAGTLAEIDTRENHLKILCKLPVHIRRAWQGKISQGTPVDVESIAKFIEETSNRQNHVEYGDEVLFPEFKRSRIHAVCVETDQEDGEDREPVQDNSDTSIATQQVNQSNYSLSKANSSRVNQGQTSNFNYRQSQYQNHTAARAPEECLFCSSQEHFITRCREFQELQPAKRLEFIRKQHICYNDLRKGHAVRICKNQKRCRQCNKKHHTLLHEAFEEKDNEKKAEQDVPTCLAQGSRTGTVSPVAEVSIRREDGTLMKICALLDTGANRSWCTEDLVAKLGLASHTQKEILVDTLEANSKKNVTEVSLEIQNTTSKKSFKLNKVLATSRLPSLQGSIISSDIKNQVRQWEHLKTLPIQVAEEHQVKLIIGMDHSELSRPLQVVLGPEPQDPYATLTPLGWVLHGRLKEGNKQQIEQEPAACNFIQVQDDQSLRASAEKFWQLDRCIGDEVTDFLGMSKEDKKVEDYWETEIKKTEDNHYELPIPYKDVKPQLPPNRIAAEERLSSLRRRMERDKEFKERYDAGMESLINKGYAEEVTTEKVTDDGGKVWYLPHFEVYDTEKKKSRIVFDAAAKLHNKSINTETFQGPDYTNYLPAILLNFRRNEIAVMGDIEEMFYQCQVKASDRDSLRFLYWKEGDITREPTIYRMKVHVFGGRWCPSVATFTMRYTARAQGDDHSLEAVKSIYENFYVDDFLQSYRTPEEALSQIQEITKILGAGGFKLTKWISNSKEVLEAIPKENHGKSLKTIDLETEHLPRNKALGVVWDLETDSFQVKTQNKKQNVLTRRGVLSTMASVFDPLGIVAPFILTAKIIFREATRRHQGWDHQLDPDLANKWIRWLKDLTHIANFSIPRCLSWSEEEETKVQVHIFSDASNVAYASVAYLRVREKNQPTKVSLMICKTRLAPLKTTTIPRMELMGAVISARLGAMISKQMDISPERITYWTDSLIVLQYLTNSKLRLKTFVANRVTQILEITRPENWRHVPTDQNPADKPSRGMSAQEIVESSGWKQGPSFLYEEEESWPQTPPDNHLSELDENVNRNTIVTATEEVEEDIILQTVNRISSWRKAVKVIRKVLDAKSKFMRNSHKREDEDSSILRNQEAENLIILKLQEKHFTQERIKDLRNLDPFKDDQGIWRVGGRLKFSTFPIQRRHQAIIPNKTHSTRLLIRHYHKQILHAGVELTLAKTREKIWIINGKQSVKNEIRECITCRRHNQRPIQQKMGELPEERLEVNKAVFHSTGVDCFGPFMVQRGRGEIKKYGCIFVCLTTGAVHIEKIDDMSTNSFLLAITRFLARRPTPAIIISDNGTNLVGAHNEMQRSINEWNQEKVNEFLEQKQIIWKFQPPHASNMSGKIERQIGSVRRILERIFFEMTSKLTDESLATLFTEIEDILNSRPLSVISSDVQDVEPITPNTLLKGTIESQRLPPGIFQQDCQLKTKYRQVQFVVERFWDRWKAEYLHLLQTRQKWYERRQNLQINDILLIMDDNSPRNQWKLGKVTEIHPGRDGLVRKVTLKTRTGYLQRPVNKLCMLLPHSQCLTSE